jgi:hypothetical protein
VLFPVERACCHRRPQEAYFPGAFRQHTRRQNHTTSPYAADPFAFGNAASIASRAQRVVTMAIRPSCGRETVLVIILIFGNVKRNILFAGLTAQISLRLLRKSDFRRNRFALAFACSVPSDRADAPTRSSVTTVMAPVMMVVAAMIMMVGAATRFSPIDFWHEARSRSRPMPRWRCCSKRNSGNRNRPGSANRTGRVTRA